LEGPFSVDATAGRILGFAVSVSGGDLENNAWVESSIRMGFGNATSAWGSQLPSISQETYEAVMNGLREWREEGAGAISLLDR